jgi:hypothetical protein
MSHAVMNVSRSNPIDAGNETDIGETLPHLEMLLVYEDLSTALRAKRAVDHVVNRPEIHAVCQTRVWKLEVLGDEACNKQAMHDGLISDIVVLSGHGNNGLISEAAARLTQWIDLKRGTPCVLVISLDSEAMFFRDENSDLTELCSTATRCGITVILHTGEPVRTGAFSVPRDIQGLAVTTAPVLDDISPAVSVMASHWGINE